METVLLSVRAGLMSHGIFDFKYFLRGRSPEGPVGSAEPWEAPELRQTLRSGDEESRDVAKEEYNYRDVLVMGGFVVGGFPFLFVSNI